MGKIQLHILPEPAALWRHTTEWLLSVLAGCERPAIALPGGGTPLGLFHFLVTAPWREMLPWDRIHWFWGDERCVPPDNPESNFGAAHRTLLSRLPIPRANIHPIPAGNLPPEAAADAYERELQDFYGATWPAAGRPLFQAVLLGLGSDGHTASLFPGSPVLTECRRWVTPVHRTGGLARLTLTLPVLASSRHTAFLVTGQEKRHALSRLLAGAEDVPAARIRSEGSICVFADPAAAEGKKC